MNRRDFLKLSGGVLANTVFFPVVKKGRPVIFIGSVQDFFDIQYHALEPGMVVYWRGGTYKLRDQQEQVCWAGSEGLPILIRPYKNEKVIIDGSINPRGPYQHWYGFEIFNSRWLTRGSQYPPGDNPDIGPVWEAFNNDADRTIIENCVIHDCRQGIRAIKDNDVTIKDCVIYNNGYSTQPDGYAHEIYWNGDGLRLEGNVIMSGKYSAWGLHGYGGEMHNLICKDNVFVDCSCMARSGNDMTNIQMIGNEIVGLTELAELEVGAGANGHSGIIVKDNYILNGRLRMRSIASGEIKNNVVATKYGPVVYESWPDNTLAWDENKYYRESNAEHLWDFSADGNSKTFEEWQSAYGFDLNSEFVGEYPTTPRTRVINTDARTITVKYHWPKKEYELFLSDMNLGMSRNSRVLKKLYPGVYELNQQLGDLVVRMPPAPYATWLKDVEEGL